jgi:hypothetical protein
MSSRPRLIIASILGVVVIVCSLLWWFASGSKSDFGLNALTETLGIAATVFVIDYLIQEHEVRKLLPQRASAYEDVRLLASRIVSFWTEAYRVSVPGEAPKTIKELLSEESIRRVSGLMHLDSLANITPKRECWDWVAQNLADFQTRSEKILERHNGILEPAVYSTVHTLSSDTMEPGLMRGILQSDREMGFPRPKTLGHYCFFQRSFFDSLLSLVDWCGTERIFLEKHGFRDLKRVTDSVHPWPINERPQCMIPPELLQKQINEVAEFHARSAKA